MIIKLRNKIIVILCTLLAISLLVLVACCEQKENLEVPTNVHIHNEIISWNEVADADSYIVDINGVEFETTTTRVDIFETIIKPGNYKIKICALDQDQKYNNSDYTQSISYNLALPQGLSYVFTDEEKTEYAVYASQKNLIEGKVVIPAEHNGVPVTQVMESAFSGCNKMTGIILPNNIKDIKENAFVDCTGLNRIKLPDCINKISNNVFNGCSSLQSIYLPDTIKSLEINSFKNCSMLNDIILPDNLEVIDGAFINCLSLKVLEIPQRVEKISYNSFWGCESLTLTINKENTTYNIDSNCLMRIQDNALVLCLKNAKIPNYTYKIEERAMVEYEGSAITIPINVKSISGTAFNGCSNLKSIIVESGNAVYKSDGNCIIRKADNVLIAGCKASKIPEYVTLIGENAFNSCAGLENINIPASIKVIGAFAFYNCSDLENLNLSFGVSVIEERAFGYCKLKHISLPTSVTTIEEFAFSWDGNKNFTSVVVIPGNVTNIGSCAFERCTIYMEKEEIPKGWYRDNLVMDTGWWDSATCSVFKGCSLDYDEAIPYVSSFIYYFSTEDGGYSSVAGSTEMIRYPRIPYREGYVFVGWTTDRISTIATYKVFDRNNEKVAFVSSEQAKTLSNTVLYALWSEE